MELDQPRRDPCGGPEQLTSAEASLRTDYSLVAGQLPIAICGISLRMPDGVNSCEEFLHQLNTDSLFYSYQQVPSSSSAMPILSMIYDDEAACETTLQQLYEMTRECIDDAGEMNHGKKDAHVGVYMSAPESSLSHALGGQERPPTMAELVSVKHGLDGPR